jgi:hypothetical protein
MLAEKLANNDSQFCEEAHPTVEFISAKKTFVDILCSQFARIKKLSARTIITSSKTLKTKWQPQIIIVDHGVLLLQEQ